MSEDRPPDAPGSPPSYKLYSVGSAVIATLVGSPLGGALILALNYRRHREPRNARLALTIGAFATVALFTAAALVPDDVHLPRNLFVWPQVIAAYFLADALQGDRIITHKTEGGRFESRWKAAGLGLLCLALVILVVVAVAVGLEIFRPPAPEPHGGGDVAVALVTSGARTAIRGRTKEGSRRPICSR